MKKLLISAVAAGLCISPAFAGDLEAHCVAVTSEAEDGDSSGCACLGETATGDVKDELLAFSAGDDTASLSEAAQEAIAACWPDAA